MSRLLKNSFSIREKHIYECNQACNTTKDPNIILNTSKTSLNNKKVKHINPKTSLPILYFKNKLRQFNEHTLTHVNLMMAKSRYTCTCIKSSKEYCMLCVKNIARLYKCIYVMTI